MGGGELTPVKKASTAFFSWSIPAAARGDAGYLDALVGFQLLIRGETAPAHKHRPGATRIVVEGEGAYTVVDGNGSDLCKRVRSCSIISVPGSTVTKRASGVASGILVHQNHWAAKKRQRGLLDLMPFGGMNSCNQQRFSCQERSGRGLEEQFETLLVRTIASPAARNCSYDMATETTIGALRA
jgi:hypothetical protein